MAKLYFYHGTLNAGKSSKLLLTDYNYNERGLRTLIFSYATTSDKQEKNSCIGSRIGITKRSIPYDADMDFLRHIRRNIELVERRLHAILIDDAHLLTKQQVYQLTEVVDLLQIDILTYGLRTDFEGELFSGSAHLLAWSNDILEIKTMCHCGRKALMNLKIGSDGKRVNPDRLDRAESYLSCCRYHYKKGDLGSILSSRFEKG